MNCFKRKAEIKSSNVMPRGRGRPPKQRPIQVIGNRERDQQMSDKYMESNGQQRYGTDLNRFQDSGSHRTDNRPDRSGVHRSSAQSLQNIVNKLSDNRKRKLSTMITMVSPDEGIGSSMDSMNDSIAQRIKTRDRTKGVKRVRTDFGYENIQNLTKFSVRDKSLINSPNHHFIADETHLTPKRNCNIALDKRSSKTVSSVQQMPQKNVFNCRRDLSTSLSKCSLQRRQSMATTVASNTALIAQQMSEQYESDDDLMDDTINDPLVRYENRSFWTDKDYQISCLKSAIEMLRNDESGVFKAQLKQRALEALGLPALPSGPNLQPRIIFNRKGEPNFAFHFRNPESPLDVTEELNNTNHEIIDLTLIVYDLIRIEYNPNNRTITQNSINLQNRRQISY